MAKKHTVNIRSAEGMTPEELQAGLESGRFKAIPEGEKVDLSKHNNFVAVPKRLTEPFDFDMNGLYTEIPPDAHPRILDRLSVTLAGSRDPMLRRAQQRLHKAHHFRLGFGASEALLGMVPDEETLEYMQQFAPHPFDFYTVSLWVGVSSGAIAEVLLEVFPLADGTPVAGLITMVWGHENFILMGDKTIQSYERGAIYKPQCTSEIRLAWKLCDAFRVLMARSTGRTIKQGGPPRSALRKGKRVHFYSASEIKIDLDAVKRDRIVGGNGFGKMMPVYQYRAHLCHSGGRPGCEHEWISIGGVMTESGQWIPDNENPRSNPFWECYHCGRHRWHRRAGSRGSAEVGYVQQTYNIVKGDDDGRPPDGP